MAYVLQRSKSKCRDIGLFVFTLIFTLTLASGIAYGTGTLAGTNIPAGVATISHAGGVIYARGAEVTVSQKYGLELSSPDFTAPLLPGESFYFPFTITNIGNGTDVYEFALSGMSQGWSVGLIADENSNGIYETSEVGSVQSPVFLAEDATYSFFLELKAPEGAKEGEEGAAVLRVSGKVRDGDAYLGSNGVYYGGPDFATARITARVVRVDSSVPTISNLYVNEMATLPYNIVSTNISVQADIRDDLPSNIERILVFLNDDLVYEGTLHDWKECYNPYSGKFRFDLKVDKPGSYRLKIVARDRFGNSSQTELDPLRVYSPDNVMVVGAPVAVPDPFAPGRGEETAFRYVLSADASITIYIHDLLGKVCWSRTFDAEDKQGGHAGPNQVFWNGRSDAGSILSNGIYIYKIVHNNEIIGSGRTTILEN